VGSITELACLKAFSVIEGTKVAGYKTYAKTHPKFSIMYNTVFDPY
jgi:hypothetical protein